MGLYSFVLLFCLTLLRGFVFGIVHLVVWLLTFGSALGLLVGCLGYIAAFTVSF